MIKLVGNIVALGTLATCALLLVGCDNEFSPFAEENDKETIIVNGFLDFNADTQYVRIQLVRRELERDASLDDGLAADLVNMSTGSRVLMRDSILTLSSNKKIHLFYSTEPVESGAAYELNVSGSNGGRTIRRTLVPARGGFVTGQIENIGGQNPIRQQVRLNGLGKRPDNVTVSYSVLKNGVGEPIIFDFAYDDFLIADSTGSGYSMNVQLEIDRNLIVSGLNLPASNGTTVLESISVRYDRFSDEWQAEQAVTDANFFASAATYEEIWTLPDNALSALMYAIP